MANIFKPNARKVKSKKPSNTALKAVPKSKSIIRSSWEDTALWIVESGASWVKYYSSGLEAIINDKYITIDQDWNQYKIVVCNKDNLEDNIEYIRLDVVDLEWNKWIA